MTSGVYSSAPSVTLSYPSGASAYYTTDNTLPSASNGTLYNPANGVVGIAAGNGSSTTVRAISVESGYISSTVVSATYEINYSQVSTPQLSVAGGVYTSDQSVALSDSTTGATIYYTTDGTTPTYPVSGTTQTYTGTAISVNGIATGPVQMTINAIAAKTGMATSTEASASYTISYGADTVTPTISITPTGSGDSASSDGTHITATANPTITFSGGTASTTYYYSWALNATPSTPTLTGTSVTAASGGTFTPTGYGAGATTTLAVDVFAVDPGTSAGATATATFTINANAATPAFSISPARYSADQALTISDTTPGATMYAAVASNATSIATPPSPAVPTSYTSSGSPSTTVALAGPLQSYAVEAIGAAPGYVSSAFVSTPTTQPFIIVYPKITETAGGSYSFTVPNGLSSLTVTAKLWGAGGGGGSTSFGGPAGTGGGGGFAETTVTGLSSATAATGFTIDVGTGGSSGSNGGLGGGESDFYVISGGTTTWEATAGGGGQGMSGGGNYGTLTVAGNYQTPANSGDADYQSGYGRGGGANSSGTGGLAVIYLN